MNSESENMYRIEIGIIGSSRVIRSESMEQYKANIKYADICYGISCRRGIFQIYGGWVSRFYSRSRRRVGANRKRRRTSRLARRISQYCKGAC